LKHTYPLLGAAVPRSREDPPALLAALASAAGLRGFTDPTGPSRRTQNSAVHGGGASLSFTVTRLSPPLKRSKKRSWEGAGGPW
jgi:hypothetical protein